MLLSDVEQFTCHQRSGLQSPDFMVVLVHIDLRYDKNVDSYPPYLGYGVTIYGTYAHGPIKSS
ncbi:hypothetical protein PROAA_220030 [Candidatus Propionivibrio aalborgensis]|uniref:Uncharacterized protein n=1 Tax=Candidatus Propionivibrio aalborgensis TaxID=1860101 RepID=A0A1A8XU63_9RHOO|nr:hypothetical protein PROAA_220030 [Candidatus Propionivibrio aalborgensis]